MREDTQLLDGDRMRKSLSNRFVKSARHLLAKSKESPWEIMREEVEGEDTILWVAKDGEILSQDDAELIIFMRDHFDLLVDFVAEKLNE